MAFIYICKLLNSIMQFQRFFIKVSNFDTRSRSKVWITYYSQNKHLTLWYYYKVRHILFPLIRQLTAISAV
jgi:hypothetical protein